MENRNKQLKIANKIEDKNIKRIEKQLKLNRRKSKTVPKSFVDDGLDYLLEICDPENRGKLTRDEFDYADNDAGFEEDLAFLKSSQEDVNTGVNKDGITRANKRKKCTATKSSWNVKDIVSKKVCTEGNWKLEPNNTSKDGIAEDIYGRLRDKSGNIIGNPSSSSVDKYVPPGKRLQDSTTTCLELLKLKRQLKGLFNRLSESNLPSIISTIEKLYLSNTRHNMQEVINTLLLDSLVSSVLSPERLIMEHCVLIATLHTNIGVEVGAQFLEIIIRNFDSSYTEYSPQDDNKKLDNLILIIAHMYNFGIMTASLLKDILLKLAEKFEEKEIDLILIMLRTVGFAWRKDDPLTLKHIIVILQTKAGKITEQPPRIRFMLEILMAIRNNNMTKIPNYDTSHVECLRKLLRTLTARTDSPCKLNITYDELLIADKRGRWWVVGSAWAGLGPTTPNKYIQSEETTEPQINRSLLEMARKQRMNTELRRNIFCILMTAEDFMGAFDNLIRLGLKGQQEREIIFVIIDCCLQEKVFNPYYTHLLQKFCHFHRRYQIACQFALWDRFKELTSLSQIQTGHLAKLVVHLTMEGSLSLSILKVIHFTELDRSLVRFLRQILLGKISFLRTLYLKFIIPFYDRHSFTFIRMLGKVCVRKNQRSKIWNS